MRLGESKLFPMCACGRPAPLGKRKCARCISTKNFKVTTGKNVTKGKNARGTCLHKPDKPRTKRPKRQSTGGLPPRTASTQWL
jgi:hypothetical protein